MFSHIAIEAQRLDILYIVRAALANGDNMVNSQRFTFVALQAAIAVFFAQFLPFILRKVIGQAANILTAAVFLYILALTVARIVMPSPTIMGTALGSYGLSVLVIVIAASFPILFNIFRIGTQLCVIGGHAVSTIRLIAINVSWVLFKCSRRALLLTSCATFTITLNGLNSCLPFGIALRLLFRNFIGHCSPFLPIRPFLAVVLCLQTYRIIAVRFQARAAPRLQAVRIQAVLVELGGVCFATLRAAFRGCYTVHDGLLQRLSTPRLFAQRGALSCPNYSIGMR